MLRPRLDIPFRKEKSALAVAVGVGSAVLLGGPIDANAACAPTGSGPCYAIGETTGFIADGAAARFDSRQYVTQDWQSGGFTEQTLWIGVENSNPGAEWCEVGWTKGWINPTTGEPEASVSHYYAFSVNGVYNEAFPASPAVGSHGTSHHYQIHREYDGKYNFYIDNIDVGDCYADPFTLWAQVGLEYTYYANAADQNNPRELELRRATDLTWFDWGDLGTSVVSHEYAYDGRAQWEWDTYLTSGDNWIGN